MSLVRLLTAGRSLVGGSHSELHYRMTSPKAMPKFGSAKNPFRSTTSPAAPSAETDTALVAAAAAEPEVPQAQPAEPVAPSQPQPAAQPGRVRLAITGLKERVRHFFSWLSRPRAAASKPAVPRFDKQPVQTELSLDRIKVVRNDLSDADLEVVPRATVTPAKAPAKSAPAAPAHSQPELVAVSDAAESTGEPSGPESAAGNHAGRLVGATKS